ncbi:MAG: hypothetical protein IT363_08550 [Methanoregulaceae archaeon]|nr:hypothetical protein [Methanoregulaceae archaeon]
MEERLEALWREHRRQGKLTRRGMAELLHLSEKTVDRLLRGEKVDRATVKLAFQLLEIEWDDAFVAIDENLGALPSPVGDSELRPRRARLVTLWPVALIVVVLGGWLGFRQPDLSVKAQDPYWRVTFFDRLATGTEHYHKARYDQARVEFAAVMKLATRHDDLAGQAEATRMTADVDLAQGQVARARDGYHLALQLRERTGETSTYPALQQALGAAELKLKNYGAAKAWMRLALEGYAASSDGVGMALVQRDLGTLSAAEGDSEGALAWFATARSGLNRGVNSALLMDVRAQEALVLLDRGEFEKADQMLKDCLEYWERENHPRWVARTKLQLSRAKAAAGEHSLADRLRMESASAFRWVGDTGSAGEAEDAGPR